LKTEFQEDPGQENLARALGNFRPVHPGERLKERIRLSVGAEERPVPGGWFQGLRQRVSVRFVRWVSVAAAMVVAVPLAGPVRRTVVGLFHPEKPDLMVQSATPESGEFEEETLWGQGEVAGIVDTGDGQPMWKLRYETVRRLAWSDRQGFTRLHFEPEERIIFVPVSYN